MQDVTPAAIDLLVTLSTSTHGQGGVHVDVMAGQVKTDQALEDNTPSREGRSQEDEQT